MAHENKPQNVWIKEIDDFNAVFQKILFDYNKISHVFSKSVTKKIESVIGKMCTLPDNNEAKILRIN